jgi:hypothetical protein
MAAKRHSGTEDSALKVADMLPAKKELVGFVLR